MRQLLLLFLMLLLIFTLRLFLFPVKEARYQVGQSVNLTTVLNAEPKISGQTQRFEILGLEIISRRYPEYHYGDKLKISGTVSEESKLVFPQIQTLGIASSNWWLSPVLTLRHKVVDFYQSSLPQPAGSLLAGIVIGDKSGFEKDFWETLRLSGVLHVVVASGMNVTLVSGFLIAVFGRFLKRQLAAFLAILGIIFYTVLAGFEPPIIRAAIMGATMLISQILGRQTLGLLTLGLAGYLMLLVSPSLINDLGFQLSFLSTAGLLVIRPYLSWFDKIPLLGEDLSTTLAAQIATLPLLLVTFGQYSLLSLATNTLVLWTIPWVMGFGGVAGILGLIFPILGQLSIFLIYPFLFYFEQVVRFFGGANILIWKFDSFPWSLALGYWLILAAGLVRWSKRKNLNAN